MLPTKTLLHLRCINSYWKSVTNQICRRRHVHVILYNNCDKEVMDLYQTFSKSNPIMDYPWSSLKLCRVFGDPGQTRDATPQGWKKNFGYLILGQVWDYCSYTRVLNFIQWTPNLQRLEITNNQQCEDGEMLEFPPPGEVVLPKLKYFKIILSGLNDLRFVKYLLTHCSVRLELIDITCLLQDSSRPFKEILSLISQIPQIGLSIHFNSIQPGIISVLDSVIAASAQLRISSLSLHLEDVVDAGGQALVQSHQLPERLISSQVNQLEVLEVFVVFKRCPLSLRNIPRFTLPPVLPRLKSLLIDFMVPMKWRFDRYGRPTLFSSGHIQYDFFNSFETAQFPNLKRVSIKSSNPNGSFENIFRSTESSQFPSVLELDVEYYNERDDWNRVFPNLKSLKTGASQLALLHIFAKWTTLEHLDLVVLHGVDANAVLTGVKDPDAVYQLWEKGGSRPRPRVPCLLDMTGRIPYSKLKLQLQSHHN